MAENEQEHGQQSPAEWLAHSPKTWNQGHGFAKAHAVSRIFLFFSLLGKFSTGPILAGWQSSHTGQAPSLLAPLRGLPPSNHKATGGLRAPTLSCGMNSGNFPPHGGYMVARKEPRQFCAGPLSPSFKGAPCGQPGPAAEEDTHRGKACSQRRSLLECYGPGDGETGQRESRRGSDSSPWP